MPFPSAVKSGDATPRSNLSVRIIGAPELHHWHHERAREAGNYANLSPLMDIIFGTYRCPDQEPRELGVEEPMPRCYLGQMLHPFRIRRRKKAKAAAPDETP